MATGHIEKRGEAFRLCVYLGLDAEGKKRYRRETFRGTEREAQRRLRAIIAEVEAGISGSSTMTLAELLETWLAEWVAPNRSPVTVDGYRNAMRRIIPEIGHISLQKLRPLDLQRYYRKMLESGRADGTGGLSPTSVHSHHRCLHAALGVAVKWELVARNVADAVQPPQPRKNTGEPWTSEQLARFLGSIAEHRLFAMYALAALAGLRRGEVAGLRWADVDASAGLIRIEQTIVRVEGRQVVKLSPKTQASKAEVPISSGMCAILDAHRKAQQKERWAVGDRYDDHGLVFCQPTGTPLYVSNMTRDFRTLCRRAGVPEIRFHDLRHTHATQLLDQGHSLPVVQQRLRHSRPSTTLDMYGHAVSESERSAAQALDHVLPD